MRKTIAVIIPFFQREPGILRKAIHSVANQRNIAAGVEIIVVDDGSPISADSEVIGLVLPENVTVRVIRQKNTGCYPACNVALNSVGEDAEYIAFLDSDDEWSEEHLGNALWALKRGYEFYFSDFHQLNQTVTAFQRRGRININQHKKVHPSEPIYEFSGRMFDQILQGNVLGTSTIVYSRSMLGDLRYREDFRHTGGEYLLWLNMAARTSRIAFSILPECRYGGGVNIYSEAAWGTAKFLTVLQDEIKYRKCVLSSMEVSPNIRKHVKSKIRESRVNFCLGLIHNLIHNRTIGKGILMRQVQQDPLTLPTLLGLPFRVLAMRLKDGGSPDLSGK